MDESELEGRYARDARYFLSDKLLGCDDLGCTAVLATIDDLRASLINALTVYQDVPNISFGAVANDDVLRVPPVSTDQGVVAKLKRQMYSAAAQDGVGAILIDQAHSSALSGR